MFSVASGQTAEEIEVKLFSDSLIKRFESLPDKDAFELWLESRDPIIAGIGMIDSAVKNERLDFLNRVFGDRGEYSYLINAVDKLPDSVKRDKLTIMMLRWESPFWPDENAEPIYDGSRPGVTPNSVEPFVGVIVKYFPALLIDDELLSSKAKRFKLATALEVAMDKVGPSPQAERPKKRTEQQETPQAFPYNNRKHPDSELAAENVTFSKPEAALAQRLTWGAGFFVIASLLWMLARMRMSK
jgi:hypothetical protein